MHHHRNTMFRLLGAITALSGAGMIVLGALGAHHWAATLSPLQQHTFDIALRYQAWHTLALLAVLMGTVTLPWRGVRAVCLFWIAGMCCFSGSLYAISLGGYPLGWVTPVGGLLLIVGWCVLAWQWVRHVSSPSFEAT